MSFNIGLSGLYAANKALNVTGNNIANVATTGFKSSRAEFADQYSNSIRGTSAGKTVIGTGVKTAAVSQLFTPGNINATGQALDMAIDGNGFFALNDNGSKIYTRAGAFYSDKAGYVVNASGANLQGYAVGEDGKIIQGILTDLQIDTSNLTPKPTSLITEKINLNSAAGFDVGGTAGTLTGLGLTAGSVAIAPQTTGLASAASIDINGTTFNFAQGDDLDAIVDNINNNGAGAVGSGTALTGVTAKNDNGRLVLTSANGQDIKLDNGSGVTGQGALAAVGLNSGTTKAGLVADTSISLNGVEVKFKKGDDMDSIAASINAASTGVNASVVVNAGSSTLSLFADQDITVADGSNGTGLAALGLTAVAGKTSAVEMESTVSNLNITDAQSAQQAIQVLDGAMQSLDSQRSQLGAVQNRFDSTVANLQSISENSTAARSRIQDADFAAETAELSKQQTLQQASTAILSQANQLPSSVLKLLG